MSDTARLVVENACLRYGELDVLSDLSLTVGESEIVSIVGPSFAQKAEIQNANAKWIQLFNKGDFAGIGMLYTKDAVALPPDAGIVKGREAIGAMWKDLAGKVSGTVLNTVEVKRLGPTAARELGHSN